MHTGELLVPEPSSSESEVAIEREMRNSCSFVCEILREENSWKT